MTITAERLSLLASTKEGLRNRLSLGRSMPFSDYVGYIKEAPAINDIGAPGAVGFGVGVCPEKYPDLSTMSGTLIKGHDNYGNYQYKDGSVMVWVPAFFYRYGDGSNPSYPSYGVNSVDVVPRHAYPTILAAGQPGMLIFGAGLSLMFPPSLLSTLQRGRDPCVRLVW